MLFILLALVFYTIAILLGTLASRNTNTNLVSAIMSLISAAIPTTLIIPILNKKLLSVGNNKIGILAAIVGGIALAIFTMAVNKSYAENKVAIVVPIVFGGSILLSGILGSILFKEKITPLEGFGLGLLGIALLLITYARMVGK